MAAQDTTHIIAGAVVAADGQVTPVRWDSADMLASLYRLIGCNSVDLVRLDDDLDMWVDDEGSFGTPYPNWAITAVAAAYGRVHQRYFGTAVFTGGVDEEGNSLSLSPAQLQQLTEMLTE